MLAFSKKISVFTLLLGIVFSISLTNTAYGDNVTIAINSLINRYLDTHGLSDSQYEQAVHHPEAAAHDLCDDIYSHYNRQICDAIGATIVCSTTGHTHIPCNHDCDPSSEPGRTIKTVWDDLCYPLAMISLNKCVVAHTAECLRGAGILR